MAHELSDAEHGFQKQTELVEVEVRSPDVSSAHPNRHHHSYSNTVADDRTHDGSVDFKGRSASKSHSGGIKAASFIIGVELGERLAYYGIQANLFVYLTTVLREKLPEASRNATNWTGVTLVMPIVGGFLADAYWGKFWTIAIVSGVYVLGMTMLTLSASVPTLKPQRCTGAVCPKVSKGRVGFFFLSLYMISVGTGGIKPCLEAFGADQFDDEDVKERKQKSSFFNWWYFAICVGGLVAVTVIIYIDNNVSWGLGFGIPTIVMLLACVIFFMGTQRYRHKLPGGSPLTQIAQVLVASLRNFHVKLPSNPASLYEIFIDPSMPASRRQILSANGVGSFISSLLVTIVSSISGHDPWLLPNLNRSRIDLFYWLLAVLSILNLGAFIVVAFFYDYKRVKSPVAGSLYNGVAPAHSGLSHKDSLQRYHHRPSNASSTSSQ